MAAQQCHRIAAAHRVAGSRSVPAAVMTEGLGQRDDRFGSRLGNGIGLAPRRPAVTLIEQTRQRQQPPLGALVGFKICERQAGARTESVRVERSGQTEKSPGQIE